MDVHLATEMNSICREQEISLLIPHLHPLARTFGAHLTATSNMLQALLRFKKSLKLFFFILTTSHLRMKFSQFIPKFKFSILLFYNLGDPKLNLFQSL